MLRFVRFCTQNTDKRRTLAITFPIILSQTCISSLLPLVNENVPYHSPLELAGQQQVIGLLVRDWDYSLKWVAA
jgi:hypothetical protein